MRHQSPERIAVEQNEAKRLELLTRVKALIAKLNEQNAPLYEAAMEQSRSRAHANLDTTDLKFGTRSHAAKIRKLERILITLEKNFYSVHEVETELARLESAPS